MSQFYYLRRIKTVYLTHRTAFRVILSGAARTDERANVTKKKRRVVEPRRGASRRDLRTVEAVKPLLSETDEKSILYVSNSHRVIT